MSTVFKFYCGHETVSCSFVAALMSSVIKIVMLRRSLENAYHAMIPIPEKI